MIKYRASFLMGLAHSLEYRFEFLVNLISTLFPIIIQVFLWFAIFDGTRQVVLYGYALPQMLAYVAVAGAVGKFVTTGIEHVINDDIHSGGLAIFLVKPVRYIPFRIFQTIGQKFASSVIMIMFIGAVLVLLRIKVDFVIVPYGVLLFFVALALATLLNFYIFFLVSTSGFWLTEVVRFFHALRLIILVMSGGIFPITVFGETYVSVSRFLPFQYTLFFPISVLTGALPLSEILTGIGLQVLWIGVLWFVAGRVWQIGLKRYVAVGG